MSSTWEIMAITILIGGAVAYLGRRIWRKLSAPNSAASCRTGCGTCSHNDSNTEATGDLVSLDSLASSGSRISTPRNP